MIMKYVRHETAGFILFQKKVGHVYVANHLGGPSSVVSAGFVLFNYGNDIVGPPTCFGDSSSLGKKSLPEDTKLLREQMGIAAGIDWPAGAEMIAVERFRQIHEEGRTAEHDDGHQYADLAVHAAVCAVDGTDAVVVDALERGSEEDSWGLLHKYGYKGKDPNRIKLLIIAGALIAAEIDRTIREEQNRRSPRPSVCHHREAAG